MESTGRFDQRRRVDGDDGDNRPAWAFTARPQGESFRYDRKVDSVRGFIDPGPAALMEFLSFVGAVRRQLEALVNMAQETDRDISTDEGYLGDLRSVGQQFQALQRSPLAWHDVHGGDAELMRRAENLLWQASSLSPRQGRA